MLWKKVIRAELSLAEATEVLRRLDAAPVGLHPAMPIVGDALRIAVDERRSANDGLYVALALVEKCRLVTADRKLDNSLRNTGLARHLCSIEDKL